MEKEILEKALNSILHGSTQIMSRQDSYGNLIQEEVRVNDLRIALMNKIAEKLAITPEFRAVFERAFTQEIIKQLQNKIINDFKFSDLPYEAKNRIDKEMKELRVEVKKYKLVAEVVEN